MADEIRTYKPGSTGNKNFQMPSPCSEDNK